LNAAFDRAHRYLDIDSLPIGSSAAATAVAAGRVGNGEPPAGPLVHWAVWEHFVDKLAKIDPRFVPFSTSTALWVA